MEFLGIGPLELLFILLIALILLGPKDMAKTGRTIGRTLRKVVTSPQWRTINQTSKEIRNLPNRLIREAGLEEVEKDLNNLKKTTADIQKTIHDSTILPPGWDKPGTTASNPLNTGKEKVGSSSTAEQPPTAEQPSNQPDPPTTSMPSEPDLTPWINHPEQDSPIVDYNHVDTQDGLATWITPPVVITSPPPPTKSDSSKAPPS